ncbi:Unknown protein [Striga hermonthica]|uniref:Endonuclease/exonuclease/phosphatase domain-containing protein n=1 Tax=Striga hermonthica TaxID=68872 RepID=A0A9N7RAN8_STRHE|nr:Unknown protein [Striga hermonthica]
MINTLIWNIRGIGNSLAKKMTKTLIKDHKLNLLALIEPKISLDPKYLCRLFNFQQVVQNASNHIWLLCDHNCQIQILPSSRQLLHVKVSSPLSPTPFLLFIVYEEHSHLPRQDLWADLLDVADNSLPWMVGGDFNIVLHLHEKKGGALPIQSELEDFQDALLDCHLSDGGYSGPPFTWYRNSIWHRIDRILFSPSWFPFFPSSYVTHLARHHSDHNVLLCKFSPLFVKPKSSFHFQNMWSRHHLFIQVVKDSWFIPSPSFGLNKLLHKLGRLKCALQSWNRTTFGNIFACFAQAQSEASEA